MKVHGVSGSRWRPLGQPVDSIAGGAVMKEQGVSVRCWQDGPDQDDGTGTTCMLPEGHMGPHEWTRDDSIEVTFGGAA